MTLKNFDFEPKDTFELEYKVREALIKKNIEKIKARKAFWYSVGMVTFAIIIYFV